MAITLHLYYTGPRGAARAFAEEMVASSTVAAIRAEAGNLQYEYFFPMEDPDSLLLIDSWENQEAIDLHHATPMMGTIFALREKYDLRVRAQRLRSEDEGVPEKDRAFLRT